MKGVSIEDLFVLGHSAMDAGRKDNVYFMRGRAGRYQSAYQQIDDLARRRLSRRVWNDYQDRFARGDDLVKGGRSNRGIKFIADLYIGKTAYVRFTSDHVKVGVRAERYGAAAVF